MDRRNAVTVQVFCLALLAVMVFDVLVTVAAVGSTGSLWQALRLEPASLVSIASLTLTLVLIRRGRVRAGFGVLSGSLVAILTVSLVLRGFHYHHYFLLRTAGVVLALPALLLGRRALWLSVGLLSGGALLGGLRDRLWPTVAVVVEDSALGPVGSSVVTMLLLALVLDRFGSALREGYAAALDRQRELEAAAAELAASNKDLAEEVDRRRHAETLLVQAQKMEALGRVAGGVAHDFNNLLTSILGFADLCRSSLPAGSPQQADLEEIVAGARRGGQLTRQLLAFARQQQRAPRLIQLESRTRAMARMLERLLGEHFSLDLRMADTPSTVLMDPTQLEQVLVNMAVNARDAMPAGGTLTISTAPVDGGAEGGVPWPEQLPRGDYVRIGVRDTGIGMDDATRERIFEPFFTTKEQGRGTGLGLATCYGIVSQAGGAITVDTGPGRGTEFQIYLPRASGAPEDGEGPSFAPSRGGDETVLVVEDDLSVRALAVRVLRGLGYQTLEARDPRDAETVAAGHPGAIDLLLTDVVMPGGDGRMLAQRLRAQRPHLRVLFMSGYAGQAGLGASGHPFIDKPFTAGELGPRVRAVLDTPPGS
jgi:signal transduction histidine kinase